MSVDNPIPETDHTPPTQEGAEVVPMRRARLDAPSVEARSPAHGGPWFPHPVVIGADRNPTCGHHLAAFCLGCSACTDCTRVCYCEPDDTEPPADLIRLAS